MDEQRRATTEALFRDVNERIAEAAVWKTVARLDPRSEPAAPSQS